MKNGIWGGAGRLSFSFTNPFAKHRFWTSHGGYPRKDIFQDTKPPRYQTPPITHPPLKVFGWFLLAIHSKRWTCINKLLIYTALGDNGFKSCCYTQYLVSLFLQKSLTSFVLQLTIRFGVCFWKVQNHWFHCHGQWNQRFGTLPKHTQNIIVSCKT